MSDYSFEKLEVYQKARKFRQHIYLIIKQLPPEEKFNLTSQMRRAATSLTNNIAEGHGRFHFQENIQFLRQSRGSLEELIDDINICFDENYLSEEECSKLKIEAEEVLHRINGYIAYLRKRKQEEKLTN